MGNSVFIFKEFAVKQDACAMKVGTDGVLLGAWARGGSRVLDIGTGTGLIALMMAQRFPEAEIEAIDIAEAACLQAKENVANSVFARRVRVVRAALQQYVGPKSFDCIVSNPPFFVDSLHNPDALRSMARHTSTLSYRELFAGVGRLLVPEGRFSAIIPADCRSRFMAEAIFLFDGDFFNSYMYSFCNLFDKTFHEISIFPTECFQLPNTRVLRMFVSHCFELSWAYRSN